MPHWKGLIYIGLIINKAKLQSERERGYTNEPIVTTSPTRALGER
jgi:hypothetical protein